MSTRNPAALVFFAVLAIYSMIYVTRGVRDPGAADGFYSFLYARSLAFDGDIDFRNDYALCGDPYRQGVDRGTGHLDNPAYAGPAVFWTPLVVLGRVVTSLAKEPADVRAGCRGPIAQMALASSMPLGALAIALSFACARRFARTGIAAIAALLFAVASSLPQYACVFVSSSHVHECFAAALVLWLSFRAFDRSGATDAASHTRWALVGLACALCTLQRGSDAAMVVVPLVLIATSTGPLRARLVDGALVSFGAGLGALMTLAQYTYMYGSPFVLPQGRHFLHFGHAHPWLVLFAPHGGLFYTTPIAYLAVAGFVVAVRNPRQRRLAFAAALIVGLCVFVSSAALDWHGKATFGARRLVVLTPLFVIFAAVALEAATPWITRRWPELLAGAVLVLFGVPVIGGVLGTTNGETSLEGGSQAATYGGGVRSFFALLDRSVGDLAILPAEAFYRVRFGLPMTSFRAASTDAHYRRSYRDLSWEPNTLDFRDGALREASSGLASSPSGVVMTGSDAKVVFAAGWPFATDALLEVHAEAPTTVTMRLGTTFHRCDLGTRGVEAGTSTLAFSIPDGCFDSGLVELRFTGTPTLILTKLVLDDRRALPPPL